MRTIDKIIIHSTATPDGLDVKLADIERRHRERGIKGIDYHHVVLLDGTVEAGNVEEVTDNINIAYVGGVDFDGRTPRDTRTPEQREALKKLIEELKEEFPEATVHGHNEFANTACPSFFVDTQL